MTSAEATAVARASDCVNNGTLTTNATRSNDTWHIAMTPNQAGCTATCEVYSDGSAELSETCPQAAPAPEIPVVKTGAYAGSTILTDHNGMALYVTSNDQDDMSSCTGSCAVTWPPLKLAAGSTLSVSGVPGTLGTITLADGSKQVTYNHMPLYTYSGDTAGTARGAGIGGVWFVAKTSLTTFPTAPSSTPSYGGGYGGGY